MPLFARGIARDWAIMRAMVNEDTARSARWRDAHARGIVLTGAICLAFILPLVSPPFPPMRAPREISASLSLASGRFAEAISEYLNGERREDDIAAIAEARMPGRRHTRAFRFIFSACVHAAGEFRRDGDCDDASRAICFYDTGVAGRGFSVRRRSLHFAVDGDSRRRECRRRYC